MVLEQVISLHAPLRGVSRIAPDQALPPLPAPPVPVPPPPEPVAPPPAIPPRAEPPPEPTPPQPPPAVEPPSAEEPEEPPRQEQEEEEPQVGFWESEIGQQLQEDRAAIEKVLSRLEGSMKSLREQRRQQKEDWQRAAVELAVTLATRLVHDSLKDGSFAAEKLAREMLPQGPVEGPVTVWLHPDDLALLQNRLGEKPLFDGQEVRLIADGSLGRGDCRVESGEVMHVSQLEVQLAEMRRELLRSLGHARV